MIFCEVGDRKLGHCGNLFVKILNLFLVLMNIDELSRGGSDGLFEFSRSAFGMNHIDQKLFKYRPLSQVPPTPPSMNIERFVQH